MMATWLIFRRECQGFFLSPVAYLTGFFFLIISGFYFWILISLLGREPVSGLLTEHFFASPALSIILLITTSVLPMRLLAEERKSGTLEVLLTAPVTDAQVVAGKYAAACALFLLMLAPTILYVPVLEWVQPDRVAVDRGHLLCGFSGVALIGCTYIAIGTLFSASTATPVVAAIGTLVANTLIFLAGSLAFVPDQPVLQALGRAISVYDHLALFARGILDTRPLCLYSSMILFSLFSAMVMLGRRRWS